MTDQTNVVRVVDSITAQMQENARTQIAEIHKALVPDHKNARLPESVFKQEFLPYFSGKVDVTTSNPVLGRWVGVAGTAMSEVDVFDDVTGDTIYTVPALTDTTVLNVIDRKPGNSFADIFENFKLYGRTAPGAGNQYLAKALDQKIKDIVTPQVNTSTVADRWIAIIGRYETDAKTTSSKNSTFGKEEPDVVYD